MKLFDLANWMESPRWFRAFVVITIVSVAVYVVNVVFWEINPGNIWGLTYGSIAAVLMLGAALYGIRRRAMSFSLKFGLGRTQTWAQYHIYGGTICMLFILMHIGFRLPSGPLNWMLWSLSIWVTLSGIFGTFLQKWIPALLASGLSVEVVYERIPELINAMREDAEKLIEKCSTPVKDFYQRNIAPVLIAPKTRMIYYLDITGGIQSEIKKFEYLGKVLGADDKQVLQRLESIYKTKLELDAHYTLQKALRVWLFTHLPLSLVLVVLAVLHLYAVLFY